VNGRPLGEVFGGPSAYKESTDSNVVVIALTPVSNSPQLQCSASAALSSPLILSPTASVLGPLGRAAQGRKRL
jgi:hypothetical protein